MADNPKPIYTSLSDSDISQTTTHKYTWIKNPYGIRLESDPRKILHSIIEVEKFVMAEDSEPKTIDEYAAILKGSVRTTEGGLGGEFDKYNVTEDEEVIEYFTQPNLADTRVGCNDAINPYWQFNRDDDIRPPGLIPNTYAALKNTSTRSTNVYGDLAHSIGMGRVYSEVYDQQQQILWIEAGVPRFTNLMTYYRDAADRPVADAINSGNLASIAYRVASLAVQVTVWTFFFPIMSLIWIPRWMERLTNERITKYYTFKSTMTQYYDMVNSMLQYTAVSMGIHPLSLNSHNLEEGSGIDNGREMIHSLDLVNDHEKKTYTTTEAVKTPSPYGGYDVHYETKTLEVDMPKTKGYSSYPGVPDILRNGPDIFKIMNRRSQMIDIKNAIHKTSYSTRELLDLEKAQSSDVYIPPEAEADYKENAWSITNGINEWWSTLKGSVLGSGNHVGFRIERGASFSEDFANTTGETGLAEKFNSMAEKYKEENEIFGRSMLGRVMAKSANTMIDTGVNNLKKGFWEAAADEVKKATVSVISSAAQFDIGSVLVTGNGFLEIPKVWKNSSMTRSYNFGFKLRSRYGDPVSVFQSIYIPLFMLIALAAPRAIGSNAYTSPFLIRAFCKGMFNIPLGIVTSLSITRGSQEFGWSSQFYPLEVNVTMTIEDLSPQLFVSMSNGIIDTFSRNTSMQAYLDTLSALGLRDMIYMWPKMVRKMDTALAIARSTTFNSHYHGTALGKSRVGKLVGAFVPYRNDRAAL